MQINNKIVIIVVITIVILVIYVISTRNDISRYRNIIDTYMSNNSSSKKSSMKKIRFNEPNKK